MATRQRPSAAAHTLLVTANPEGSPNVRRPVHSCSRFVFPFDVPVTPEALALRIVKNFGHFGLFYAMLLWVGLTISLMIHKRMRGSLSILLLMTAVTNSYLILLRLTPHPIFMHRATDKALVMLALGAVMAVELVLNNAAIQMLLTIAIGVPAVLVHATFWRDDLRVVSGNGNIVEEEMSEVSEFTAALVNGPRSDEVEA